MLFLLLSLPALALVVGLLLLTPDEVLRPLGRSYPWSMRPAGALMTGDAAGGCKGRRVNMSDEVVG